MSESPSYPMPPQVHTAISEMPAPGSGWTQVAGLERVRETKLGRSAVQLFESMVMAAAVPSSGDTVASVLGDKGQLYELFGWTRELHLKNSAAGPMELKAVTLHPRRHIHMMAEDPHTLNDTVVVYSPDSPARVFGVALDMSGHRGIARLELFPTHGSSVRPRSRDTAGRGIVRQAMVISGGHAWDGQFGTVPSVHLVFEVVAGLDRVRVENKKEWRQWRGIPYMFFMYIPVLLSGPLFTPTCELRLLTAEAARAWEKARHIITVFIQALRSFHSGQTGRPHHPRMWRSYMCNLLPAGFDGDGALRIRLEWPGRILLGAPDTLLSSAGGRRGLNTQPRVTFNLEEYWQSPTTFACRTWNGMGQKAVGPAIELRPREEPEGLEAYLATEMAQRVAYEREQALLESGKPRLPAATLSLRTLCWGIGEAGRLHPAPKVLVRLEMDVLPLA